MSKVLYIILKNEKVCHNAQKMLVRKQWIFILATSQYKFTATVIHTSLSATTHLPHFIFSRLKVKAVVWKMVPCQSSAMSKLRCHVDSPIL